MSQIPIIPCSPSNSVPNNSQSFPILPYNFHMIPANHSKSTASPSQTQSFLITPGSSKSITTASLKLFRFCARNERTKNGRPSGRTSWRNPLVRWTFQAGKINTWRIFHSSNVSKPNKKNHHQSKTRNGWYNPFPSYVFEFCIGFTI